MEEFIDFDKLGATLVLINAVECDDLVTAQSALNRGIDPKEILPYDLEDFIDDQSGIMFKTPISNVKSLEMAKLLCPDETNFDNVKDIRLVGDKKEITEYYMSKGLDPKLLDYLHCYNLEKFLDMGVTKGIHYVTPELSEEQIDKVVELVKCGYSFGNTSLFRQNIKIIKAEIETHNNIEEINYDDNKFRVKYKNGHFIWTVRDLRDEVKQYLDTLNIETPEESVFDSSRNDYRALFEI